MPDPGRSYSFRTARYAPAALYAVFALILLAVVVAPGASPGVRAGFLVAALPCALLAVRCLRLALVVGEEGVVVRNALRTTRIPWSDVARFESRPWLGRAMPYEIGAIHRRGGAKPVLVHALTPPFGDPAPLASVVRELERLRSERG